MLTPVHIRWQVNACKVVTCKHVRSEGHQMFDNLGRFIVPRGRWVLVASVLALVAGAALGVSAFAKMDSGGQQDPNAESSRAAAALTEHFGAGTDYVFLVRAVDGDVDSPETAAFGRELTRELAADPRLTDIVSYWETGAPAMRATDGAAAVILAGDPDPGSTDEAEQIIADYRADGPVALVQVGGFEPTFHAISTQIGQDLGMAEGIAVPIILTLLVLAFGNVVAAALVLLTGGIAILGTFAELSVLGSLTDVSIYAVNLTTALGLGLAVGCGLLMVSRLRERRAGGASTGDAVVAAVAASGRTIAFSAATVVAALSSLVIFPQYFLRSFAYAGIGVVAISALAAVLTLPALLVVLGDRSDALRVPGVRGLRGDAAPFWAGVARTAMRRPLLTGLPVVLILLLAAAPLAGVRFGTPDDRALPTSVEARQVGDAMRTEFAGGEQGT